MYFKMIMKASVFVILNLVWRFLEEYRSIVVFFQVPNTTLFLTVGCVTTLERLYSVIWDYANTIKYVAFIDRYDKSEHLKPGSAEMDRFTHLLVEAKAKYAYNLKHYTDSHEIMGHVEAFSHFSLNYHAFPPIKIRLKPAIYLLRKLPHVKQTQEQIEMPIEFDVLPEQLSNQS